MFMIHTIQDIKDYLKAAFKNKHEKGRMLV